MENHLQARRLLAGLFLQKAAMTHFASPFGLSARSFPFVRISYCA